MIYIVTYELNNKEKDYAPLFETLKTYGTWWHYVDSSWLIKTADKPGQISEKILPYLDKVTDNLLVMEIKSAMRSGWLPKKAWEWIQRNS